MDLHARVDVVAGRPVVSLTGSADLGSVPVLHDRLLRAVTDHPAATIVVDLDGLTVLDDTAMGVLLGSAGRARAGGGDLEVVASSGRLRERLSVTGFDRAVTVRSSLV